MPHYSGRVVVGHESKAIDQHVQVLLDHEPQRRAYDGAFTPGSRLHSLNLICRLGATERVEYRCWYLFQDNSDSAAFGLTANRSRSVWAFEFVFTFGPVAQTVVLSSAKLLGWSQKLLLKC